MTLGMEMEVALAKCMTVMCLTLLHLNCPKVGTPRRVQESNHPQQTRQERQTANTFPEANSSPGQAEGEMQRHRVAETAVFVRGLHSSLDSSLPIGKTASCYRTALYSNIGY